MRGGARKRSDTLIHTTPEPLKENTRKWETKYFRDAVKTEKGERHNEGNRSGKIRKRGDLPASRILGKRGERQKKRKKTDLSGQWGKGRRPESNTGGAREEGQRGRTHRKTKVNAGYARDRSRVSGSRKKSLAALSRKEPIKGSQLLQGR